MGVIVKVELGIGVWVAAGTFVTVRLSVSVMLGTADEGILEPISLQLWLTDTQISMISKSLPQRLEIIWPPFHSPYTSPVFVLIK